MTFKEELQRTALASRKTIVELGINYFIEGLKNSMETTASYGKDSGTYNVDIEHRFYKELNTLLRTEKSNTAEWCGSTTKWLLKHAIEDEFFKGIQIKILALHNHIIEYSWEKIDF